MKFISWNVNGLRACQAKAAIKREEGKAGLESPESEQEVEGFSQVFEKLDADFFCLQETKMQPGQLDIAFDGYEAYWNSAEKKGYSGTAIFTRHKPIAVTYGIGIDEHDLVPLFFESQAGLGTSVVKLRGLPDDDGAGANDQNLFDVGALCHYRFSFSQA